MCGILGAINREITSELLNTIKHRGPDRQSIVHDVFERNQIDLAHTRLSIVEINILKVDADSMYLYLMEKYTII